MTTFPWSSRTDPRRKQSAGNLGFVCPKCEQGGTEVRDSRQTGDGTIRRRRACSCGHKFSTLEVTVAEDLSRTQRERIKLVERLVPKLLALGEQIDLLRAEHE